MKTRLGQFLTRRGTLRYAILSLGAVLMVASILHETQPTHPRSSHVLTEVVVQKGDTLWAIARSHGPAEADTRALIAEIRQANALTDSLIHPGQVLLVPHASANPYPATS
jgi:nucleoid-associated protein YgaU